MDTLTLLGKYGLVPVVVIDDADRAIAIADALAAGGLPVMEITLRTAAGLEAIRRVHAQRPDFILGAGTVLSLEQCEAAVEAGASYIVSPGYNEPVVAWCLKRQIPVIPGCVTPSEIDAALAAGLRVVKFFPASVYGGVAGCKALYGPYATTGIRFMPTGGIHAGNLPDYADKKFIHAVGGGWLADTASVASGDYAGITEHAKQAIDLLLGFEVAHVGVNLPDEAAAHAVSDAFSQYFHFDKKVGNSSIFSSAGIEVLMSKGRGAMGHIAIRTNSVDRALFYLEKRGFSAIPDSIRYLDDGKTAKFAYMTPEIGGFAIHLLQK